MVNHQFLKRLQASSNSSPPVYAEPHRGAPTDLFRGSNLQFMLSLEGLRHKPRQTIHLP